MLVATGQKGNEIIINKDMAAAFINIAKNRLFTHIKTYGNIALLCCCLCLETMLLNAVNLWICENNFCLSDYFEDIVNGKVLSLF